jgi:RHS repeat-associated protein
MAQGYSGNDNVRQKFTGYEHDAETNLEFAQARYYSSTQGRFTSVDPLMASADIINPQTFNRYAYVGNNPVNITDPTGTIWAISGSNVQWFDTNAAMEAAGFKPYNALVGMVNGGLVALNPNANSYQAVANAAEVFRVIAGLGAGAAAIEATAGALGVPGGLALAYVAAMNTPGPIDATMDDCMACGRMIQNHVNMMNKRADEQAAKLAAQVNQSSSVQGQSSPANPDPDNNKPNTDANKPTSQEIAKKRGGELVNQHADAGQGVGKSGGGGTRYIKAGNQLIQEANKLPKNDPLRAAMKTEGNRLLNKGRSINHK